MGSKSEMCVRMTRAVVDIVKPLHLKIGKFLKSILFVYFDNTVHRLGIVLQALFDGYHLWH